MRFYFQREASFALNHVKSLYTNIFKISKQKSKAAQNAIFLVMYAAAARTSIKITKLVQANCLTYTQLCFKLGFKNYYNDKINVSD